jgi:hypothetical protein
MDQIREAHVRNGVPDGYHSITPYVQGQHGGAEDPSGNHWWIATRLTPKAGDGR